MSYVIRELIDNRDIELVKAELDPERQHVISCAINAYRRPANLNVGDPVPPLELVQLGSDDNTNSPQQRGHPPVHFLGMHT